MKELRNLKIDLLTGNPNEIVNEFIGITDGISVINCDVYRKNGHEFIWYVGDSWIFYQDAKNDNFWCNYEEYWSIFESKFSLNYDDIQSITKLMIETAFKNVVGTPVRYMLPGAWTIETAFKNVVGTPQGRKAIQCHKIETAFKNVVGTPIKSSLHEDQWIETAFKNVVGTPLFTTLLRTELIETVILK